MSFDQLKEDVRRAAFAAGRMSATPLDEESPGAGQRMLFEYYKNHYAVYSLLTELFGEDNVLVYGGFIRDTLRGVAPADIDFRVRTPSRDKQYGAISTAARRVFGDKIKFGVSDSMYCELPPCGETPTVYVLEAWTHQYTRDLFGVLTDAGVRADIVCYDDIDLLYRLDYDVNGLTAKMIAPVDGGRACDCFIDMGPARDDRARIICAIKAGIATPISTEAYVLTAEQERRLVLRRKKMIARGFTINE